MALDRLNAMRTFVAVIQAGSFAGAARTLELSTPAVSRYIAELERALGVRLLQRTTRQLQLTAAGQTYLEGCQPLLDQLDALEAGVRCDTQVPHGLLRIAAPEMPRPLLLALMKYMETYPSVTVEVEVLNRTVDIIAERFDLWIHIFGPIPLGHIARPIVDLPLTICASPEYLARCGVPNHPHELADYRCMNTRLTRESNTWVFERGAEVCSVQVGGCLISNTGELLRKMALAGQGIVRLPQAYIAEDVKCGALQPLLESWRPRAPAAVSVVYPSARYVPAKVRAFVELLQRHWA